LQDIFYIVVAFDGNKGQINTFKNKFMSNQETQAEILSNETALNVAIGHEIAKLLSLKFDKQGRTKTTWGTKSVQGLGACITRIIEEQKERLS
jgi:hypothetical protein